MIKHVCSILVDKLSIYAGYVSSHLLATPHQSILCHQSLDKWHIHFLVLPQRMIQHSWTNLELLKYSNAEGA